MNFNFLKMKIIILSITILISYFVSAQNVTNILQYSVQDLNGTARYKAMSGAFGALGGDFSAIGLNPAGSAVFSSSEIGFSFGNVSLKNENTYFDKKTNNKTSDFDAGQFGFVFTIPNNNQNSQWKKISLGFNYQKTNNFDAKDLKFEGITSEANLGDYFLYYANGIRQGNFLLEDVNDRGIITKRYTLTDIYRDMGRSPNRVALRNAFIGHYVGLINPKNGYNIESLDERKPKKNITNSNYTDYLKGLSDSERKSIDNKTNVNEKVALLRQIVANKIKEETNYNSGVLTNSTLQEFEKTTKGGIRKYNFNIAGQYGDNLFWGLNLNSHTVNYKETLKHWESYGISGNITNAFFQNEKNTIGSGFSFQLGAIAKATNNLRLGLAYESPTWYSLEEEYLQYLSTNNGVSYANPNHIALLKYKFRTSGAWNASVAYIFGKNAIISLDYIYKGYGNTYFRTDYLKGENDIIQNELGDSNAIRLGGEYRFILNQKNSFSLRAGYRYEQSPYKNTKYIGDLNGYSLGAGFAFSGIRLDVSYDIAKQDNQYQMYESVLTTPVKVASTHNNLLFTLSAKLF